jgi:hypothetical protein
MSANSQKETFGGGGRPKKSAELEVVRGPIKFGTVGFSTRAVYVWCPVLIDATKHMAVHKKVHSIRPF